MSEQKSTLRKFICFNLGKEQYAIELLSIKEVISIPEVTPIPQMPSYFLGMMNLRGQVISIMDLRLKLGIEHKKSDENTVMILEFNDNQYLGVVVDAVNNVISISNEDISEKPMADKNQIADYISHVYRSKDSLIMILDIYKSFSIQDLNHIANKAA